MHYFVESSIGNFLNRAVIRIQRGVANQYIDRTEMLVGLGDQVLYPDHFVDGMAQLKSEFIRYDVQFVGMWPTDGYDHTGSDAVENGMFIGLALDEDQQPELSPERIKTWTDQLKSEFNL